jgi:TfoX/Sxy family transcriptional regulator of competence genes
MGTDAGFMQYVCDQARGGGVLSFRRMFGEYAFYCDGKVVALVCDNQVFLKPTEPGRALLSRIREGQPYPGARPHWLIDETLEDGEAWAKLVATTAQALPAARARPPARAAARTTGKKTARKKPARIAGKVASRKKSSHAPER